jgi:molybdopterin synthase catalytic subunit
MIECKVTSQPLDGGALFEGVGHAAAGAIALFVGTARNTSSERGDSDVMRLEYEAYVPMAEREMQAIVEEAVERFGAVNAIVHHRVGTLAIGDAAVVVAVSTPHRAEAFDACRFIIEELKKRVPIWKKEVFVDGAEWVNARP